MKVLILEEAGPDILVVHQILYLQGCDVVSVDTVPCTRKEVRVKTLDLLIPNLFPYAHAVKWKVRFRRR
ncbi:hypothetical protein AB4874_04275 [Thioclava sp. 15-R06ZXC-3]|uniref:Response regulatory domain-containing protein n=1 Tax=Thioclava arctica TaxID=3238301 RepID=A0ABV3TH05_9RHOB